MLKLYKCNRCCSRNYDYLYSTRKFARFKN